MTDLKTRRQYTVEEKQGAVALCVEKGVPAASAELGVAQSMLWRWRLKFTGPAKPPSSTPPTVAAGPAAPRKKARPRHVAKSWTPSQRAEILEHAAAHGVSAASEKYKASRFSIYELQRRVQRAGAGEGVSPTSGPPQSEIKARRDQEILDEWSRQPGLGPSQIRNQLRRKGIKVSVHTTRRVMEEAGYRPPKVERHAHDQRFEAVRPNHLWHLDFLHRNINKSSVFTLVILDDYSRFAVGNGMDDAERADLVIETFEAAGGGFGRWPGWTSVKSAPREPAIKLVFGGM